MTCDICKTGPSTYKCSQCPVRLYSCSSSCFKNHKQSTPHPPPASSPAPTPPPNPTTQQPPPGRKNPGPSFDPLLTSAKLQSLLTNNPTLLTRVQRIYATATADSPVRDERNMWRGRGGGRGGRGGRGLAVKEQTPEGTALGLIERWRRDDERGDGAGFEEFVEAVLGMLSNGDDAVKDA